jgi:hypothetical protein
VESVADAAAARITIRRRRRALLGGFFWRSRLSGSRSPSGDRCSTLWRPYPTWTYPAGRLGPYSCEVNHRDPSSEYGRTCRRRWTPSTKFWIRLGPCSRTSLEPRRQTRNCATSYGRSSATTSAWPSNWRRRTPVGANWNIRANSQRPACRAHQSRRYGASGRGAHR